MIKTIFLFFILTSFPLGAMSDVELDKLRQAYFLAVDNPSRADSLLQSLKTIKHKTPVQLAYQGACEGLKAKNVWNPYSKMSYVKQALQTLQKAINLEPTNLEIRFLRFSLQYYLPPFLADTKEMSEDKATIIELIKNRRFGTINRATLIEICQFMRKNAKYNDLENEFLEGVIG